jgi:hypothetical protein
MNPPRQSTVTDSQGVTLYREKEAVTVKPEGFGPPLKTDNPSRSDEMTACHATNPDSSGDAAAAAARKSGDV